MNITLEDKSKVTIHLDYYGNVYFNYKNKYYNFLIDGLNNLYLDEYEDNQEDNLEEKKEELVLDFDNIRKLELTDNNITLKQIAMQELEKEEEFDELEPENEYEEEYDIMKKYLGEDLEYVKENNEYSEYLEDNDQAIIYTNQEFNKLNTDEIYTPLYDCLIYNEQLLLKTEIASRIYRINIYMPNKISFRPIGEKETKYKVVYKENLFLEKLED
jgi:hypothetical protein